MVLKGSLQEYHYFKTVHDFPKDKATFAEVKTALKIFANSRNCSGASTSTTSENVALFFTGVAKAKHLVKSFRAKSFWESVGGVARQDINKPSAKIRSALFASFLVTIKTVVSKGFLI